MQARYHVIDFVTAEIGHVYALADLVVGRSGAGTLAELFALGKPSLLIPLVPTGGDEQRRNAQNAQNAGAAVVIEQADFTGERLCTVVSELLADPVKLQNMARARQEPRAARRRAKPGGCCHRIGGPNSLIALRKPALASCAKRRGHATTLQIA